MICTLNLFLGSMKLVGDAVRDGQFLIKDGNNKMSRGLKLLGLANWGYVKNNFDLINDNPLEFNHCTYNSNMEVTRGGNCALNGDHTHFIFVDDGSRYRFFGNYTEFITRFETMIRDQPPKVSFYTMITVWKFKDFSDTQILRENGDFQH